MSFFFNLFGKKTKAPEPALVAEARELARALAPSMSPAEQNKSLQPFFDRLEATPHGSYSEAVQALRVLAEAGFVTALWYRHMVASVKMGKAFLDNKSYIPYVIEHCVAYINVSKVNSNQKVLEQMAQFCENAAIPAGKEIAAAVDFLKDVDGRQDWFASLSSPPPFSWMASELRRVWSEHPQIPDILRGDLMVYRAAKAPNYARARVCYQEALQNGVSARIDADQAFKEIFGALA